MRCPFKFKKHFSFGKKSFFRKLVQILFTLGFGKFAMQTKSVVIPDYEKSFYSTITFSNILRFFDC